MMSEYQIQHVVHQLEHLFSRFTPAVSAGQWSVKFVPILEPGEEEYKPEAMIPKSESYLRNELFGDNFFSEITYLTTKNLANISIHSYREIIRR